MVKFELDFLEPRGYIGAIGERTDIDFPAFGVAFWCWGGIVRMGQDVGLVTDDEVARDLDAAHAF